MEMLQQHDSTLCAAALDLLLAVVADDAPVLESLCLVGIVPIVNQLTDKSAPGGRATRARAASFVELLCSTSGHTVQMFVACGGLAVLVEVLLPPSRKPVTHHVCDSTPGTTSFFKQRRPVGYVLCQVAPTHSLQWRCSITTCVSESSTGEGSKLSFNAHRT
jgi:hypothetical protein